MGSQGNSRELRPVRGKDHLLGQGFCLRVVCKVPVWIWGGFVNARHVCAIEHRARRTSEYKSLDAVGPTTGDDILRTQDVGLVKGGVTAPDAGLRRDMEDDIAVGAGSGDGLLVAEIAADYVDAHRGQLGIVSAREASDTVASGNEPFNYGAAEEATTACH
jgi:hypothetical protein